MYSGLTSDEISILADVLREYLMELRTEILGTDDFKYRQGLKKKEVVLEGVLGKLEHLRVTAMN